MCKVSSIPFQSSVQEIFRSFIHSHTSQVLLLVANMQEVSSSMVNHLRIMIEEIENQPACQSKCFVLLMHFPPANFFNPCYPSLFLRGWDHYYLDTVAHSTGRGMGVVSICDWFFHCCFPHEDTSFEDDSLMQALTGMLPESIPILLSRLRFGKSGGPFNCSMNASERSKVLKAILFQKGVGHILCKKFCVYWKPTVMEEYLERAAQFTINHKSTLSMTDSIQIMFKAIFFDFLVYMISHLNEDFSLDVLCEDNCPSYVQCFFLNILTVLPCPKLSELKARSTNLPTLQTMNHSPQFPFFSLIASRVEQLVDEGLKEANKKHNIELGDDEISSHKIIQPQDQRQIFKTLQEAVSVKISELVQVSVMIS